MDDTSSRRPEVHTILAGGRLEEFENLLVSLNTSFQITLGTLVSNNQMVAVDAGGDSRAGQVAGHELEQSHLGGSILHVDTVGVEAQVGPAPDTAAIVGVVEQRLLDVVQVAVEDLLGEGQALLSEDPSDFGVLVEELLIGRRQRLGRGEVSAGGGGGDGHKS